VLVGCGWVEHNARVDGIEFGTLLGPEETSAGWWLFFLVAALGLGRLTHPCVGTVVSGGCGGGCGGFGVWWCVECCIVDASIFLCLVLWFVRVCCV
jgi:hypothetical protein